MDRTTKETRRQSYDAVLPKREKRCRMILETLGGRQMTASEITEERVDYEMDKVIQNILDPNTKATAKRKITLTIELTPDDERRQIQVSVTAKSTLAATNPVATSLYVTGDSNGELVVAEMVPQVPGQLNMDGTQQEQPKLLKLVTHA